MTLQGQGHDSRESEFDDLQEANEHISILNVKLQATQRDYAAYRKKVDTELQNKASRRRRLYTP